MRYLVITVLIVAISICSLKAADTGSKVAMVDLDQLKGLILERAFKRTGNTDLKEKYETNVKKREEAQKKIQTAAMSGKFNPMDFAKDMMPVNIEITKKIDTLVDEELIIVINELFPEKYMLILEKSYRSNILYTSIVISDITQNIKQYLILQKTKNK